MQKLGENIKVSRNERWTVDGSGAVASYIHTGGKVGVLVEVGAGKEDSIGTAAFKQLLRDITLQIAAANPQALDRDGLNQEELEKEKELIREQMKDKPAKALEGIIRGKMEKHFQTHCLVDQGFVKQNGEISVKHVGNIGKGSAMNSASAASCACRSAPDPLAAYEIAKGDRSTVALLFPL